MEVGTLLLPAHTAVHTEEWRRAKTTQTGLW